MRTSPPLPSSPPQQQQQPYRQQPSSVAPNSSHIDPQPTHNHQNSTNVNSHNMMMSVYSAMMDAFPNHNNNHPHNQYYNHNNNYIHSTAPIMDSHPQPFHSFDESSNGMQNFQIETTSETNPKKRKSGAVTGDMKNKKNKKDNSQIHTTTIEMVGATSLRPKRLVWTPSLHDLFVKAVEKLGLYEARPKEILQLMNVDNVTTTHIKSHLQKYRSQFKKGNQNVAPSNSSANLSAHEENSADMAGDDEIVEKARLSPKFPIKSEQISTTSSHSSSSTSSPGHHPSTTTNLHNTSNSTQQPNDPIFDNYSDFFPLLGQQQVSYLKDLLSSVHVNGHPINTMTTTSATNHVTPPPPSNTTNSITVNVQPPPPLQYGSSSGVNTSGVSAQNTNSIPNVHIIQVNNNAPQPPIGFNAVLDQNGNVNTSFNPMTSHCDTETLNDYLGVLKQICKSEHDIYHIFEKIQAEIREQRDLNFIVEGFRLGFLCGIRFHNNFSSNNPQNTSSEQPPTSSSSSPSTNRSPCRHQ